MTATDATRAVTLVMPSTDRRASTARAGFLAGYRSSTRITYTSILDRWLIWCTANGLHPLDDVERAHVELWGRWLEEERHLMVSTVSHNLTVVRMFYGYCEEEGIVARSPAARVRMPRVPRESTTLGLERAEVARLLAVSARNPAYHALICLLTLNGLRVSEVCGADVTDLGVAQGHRTLMVRRKGSKRQVMPLSAKTARAIDAAVGERESGPLLITKIGTRMTRHNASKVIERLGREAAIPTHMHCHRCRHGYATIALDAGVPLRDVQDSMGHEDPRSTRLYDRNRGSLDRNPTSVVTAFVSTG